MTFYLSVIAGPLLLALTRDLSHDEHMYVAAGALIAQGERLYVDFAYFQTPYLPYLYAAVFTLTGGEWLLLSARLVAVAIGIGGLFGVRWVCGRLSGSAAIGDLCGILLATHHLLLFVFPFARNHVIALALILLGLACVYANETNRRWMFGFAGTCAALAIGMKLTSLPLAMVIMALCVLQVRGRTFERLQLAVFPATMGFGIGILPLLWIAIQVDPDLLYFNNLGYHHHNLEWRQSSENPGKVAFAEKLLSALLYLLKGSGIALLIALGAGLHWQRVLGQFADRKLLLSLGLTVIVAFFIALVPSPLQRDYLIAVPGTGVLLLAVVLKPIWHHQSVQRAMLVIALAGFGVASITNLRDFRNLLNPMDCAPIASAKIGGLLKEKLEPRTRVLTISPLFPLEAGLAIPPPCASGPFFYRVGALLENSELERYVGWHCSHLPEFDVALVEIDDALEGCLRAESSSLETVEGGIKLLR